MLDAEVANKDQSLVLVPAAGERVPYVARGEVSGRGRRGGEAEEAAAAEAVAAYHQLVPGAGRE